MVSVVPIRAQDALAERPQGALVERARAFALPLYEGQVLSTGEPVWPHALGLAASLASIGADPAAQAAGVLFAVPKLLAGPERDPERLKTEFGEEIAGLAAGVEKLYKLRVLTRASAGEQNEILRKMVLGMVEDIRVVLIRLASRTQTLRWFAKNPVRRAQGLRARVARHLLAARQPARRLAAEVGTGGPLVPLPRARAVQEDRADAGPEARRARAIYREFDSGFEK